MHINEIKILDKLKEAEHILIDNEFAGTVFVDEENDNEFITVKYIDTVSIILYFTKESFLNTKLYPFSGGIELCDKEGDEVVINLLEIAYFL